MSVRSAGAPMIIFFSGPVAFVALTLVCVGTTWSLVLRGRTLRSAALLSELAISARRGLPMDRELDELADTLLRGERRRAHAAHSLLTRGRDLPTALRESGLTLPSSDGPLAAGSATGTLPQALADEANRLTRRSRGAAAQFWNVGFYVLASVTAIQAVIGFLLYSIVPKFKKIFEDFGTPTSGFIDEGQSVWLALPWFDSMIDAGSVAVGYWFLPVAALQVGLIVLTLIAALLQKGIRPPGIGWIRRYVGRRRAHASRVCRALANAAEAGRPFPEALEAYAGAADSRGPALRTLSARVQGGVDIWPALRRAGLMTAGEVRL
ncbi:MAG: type II secretion system F family protein, partial [Planctomycetota bacterium]